MQVTLSDWTWRRHLAYKRLAEKSKRDAERALNGPWMQITCGECGQIWHQGMLEEEELGQLPFSVEGLRCDNCRSTRLIVDPKPRYREAS